MQQSIVERLWLLAMPALFVVLWSTGFVGAKLGLPYAEPFTFLGVRLLIASGLLLLVALLMRAPWPRSARAMASTSAPVLPLSPVSSAASGRLGVTKWHSGSRARSAAAMPGSPSA